MVWASGPCALSSVRMGLASGYVDLFDWLSVVLREDVGTRLWGVLSGWAHGLRKTVANDVSARP